MGTRIHIAERSDDWGHYAIIAVTPIGEDAELEDWNDHFGISHSMAQTPGVMKEWRRFYMSVTEHRLRCAGHDMIYPDSWVSDDDRIDFLNDEGF